MSFVLLISLVSTKLPGNFIPLFESNPSQHFNDSITDTWKRKSNSSNPLRSPYSPEELVSLGNIIISKHEVPKFSKVTGNVYDRPKKCLHKLSEVSCYSKLSMILNNVLLT